MKNSKDLLINSIVFVCGAVVMIFEITGSRVLAPYFGSSTLVWTSLIAVVLASLSIGYWYGGKLADKGASLQKFSFLLLASSASIALSILLKEPVINMFSGFCQCNKLSVLLSCVIIFSLPSFFLGTVTPYAVKLKVKLMEDVGKTVGSLYAVSTVGSIVGTIATGYWLLPYWGHKTILIAISVLTFICAALIWAKIIKKRVDFLIIIVVAAFYSSAHGNHVVDKDTEYNRIIIRDMVRNGDSVRVMHLNNSSHCARYMNKEGLVYEYHKTVKNIYAMKSLKENSVMIGGAANTFPNEIVKLWPDCKFDIVEIDPLVTYYGNKYFGFEKNKNINVLNLDGRNYIKHTQKKYNILYLDAFCNSHTVPFHLTTKEFLQECKQTLNDNGIMLTNFIGKLKNDKDNPLWAIVKTYKEVFPYFSIVPIRSQNTESLQNLIFIASNTEQHTLTQRLDVYNKMPDLTNYQVYTDDYAPIDYSTYYR